LAAGSAAGAVYVSLTPFEFSVVNVGAVRQALALLLQAPWNIPSKSDLVRNVAMAVPTGFFLAALQRSREPVRRLAALFGILFTIATLATSLEIAQAFLPDRYPAPMDIAAQVVGGVIGVVGWWFCPQITQIAYPKTRDDDF